MHTRAGKCRCARRALCPLTLLVAPPTHVERNYNVAMTCDDVLTPDNVSNAFMSVSADPFVCARRTLRLDTRCVSTRDCDFASCRSCATVRVRAWRKAVTNRSIADRRSSREGLGSCSCDPLFRISGLRGVIRRIYLFVSDECCYSRLNYVRATV